MDPKLSGFIYIELEGGTFKVKTAVSGVRQQWSHDPVLNHESWYDCNVHESHGYHVTTERFISGCHARNVTFISEHPAAIEEVIIFADQLAGTLR